MGYLDKIFQENVDLDTVRKALLSVEHWGYENAILVWRGGKKSLRLDDIKIPD